MLVPSNDTLLRTAKGGAHWLYWIAAMSLINQVLQMTEANIRFAIGLGVTDLVQGLGQAIGPAFHVAGLVIDFGILVAIAALGFFAVKLHRWAFIAGLVVVVLDTLLLLALAAGESILSIAFHAWAAFSLWTGLSAARKLAQRAQLVPPPLAAAAGAPPVLPSPDATAGDAGGSTTAG